MNCDGLAKPWKCGRDQRRSLLSFLNPIPMYKSFREFCERLLRIPPDPEPPPGDHASTQMFRAAPNFYRYLLFLWGLGSVGALVVVCWGSFGPIMAYVSMDKSKHPAGHLLLLIPGFFLGTVTLLRLFSLAVLRLNFE